MTPPQLAPSAPQMYKLECGAWARTGERVWNYYDMVAGEIGRDAGDGWFDFHGDDNKRTTLNGARCCSLDYARMRGWVVSP